MKSHQLKFLLLGVIGLAGCTKLSDKTAYNKPQGTPIIVILGSSSAEGTGANPPDSAWAKRLDVAVNKNGVKAKFVNLAFGGYSTYEELPTGTPNIAGKPIPDTGKNITKALSFKPGLVIISLPTNDIAFNYTDDEIVTNYAKITQALDAAKVNYIIFSTQPRDFSDVNERLRLKTLNDKIKAIYTYHVNDFLDKLSTPTYSIKPTYEAGDGIHVNNAGHLVIFDATMNHPIFISSIR
jgi:acyl-CoA thioesterase-1